ncbi:hypothetical protein VKT23_018513 [Stygiomarasmius scandens]|uniref:Crinkler effector protein N-terminal domain-containing protein n=1 Tax=Marasmiellus scandens TaxID=2682957 RepID=A0ABR1IS11_9AGAR
MNLTLFCCLVGSSTPFPVDISSSRTVSHLKDAIKGKKPNDLNEIDARNLSLFEVSILSGGDLAQKVEDAVKASKPLDPTMELLEIFPNEPPKKTIHIAVKQPAMDSVGRSLQKRKRSSGVNLTLFCCFVGSSTPFSVRISSSYVVHELKDAIRQKNLKRLKDTQADELELFKVSLPEADDLAQKVEDAVKASKPLRATMELLKIFPNEPPEETIHIAVKLPASQVQDSRRNILESAAHREAPLIDAQLYKLRAVQTINHPDAIFNHRPLELTGPPITIYHPVFSNFIRSMSVPTETLEFTDVELEKAMYLITIATEFYDHEDDRRDAIYKVLKGFVADTTITYHNVQQKQLTFSAGAFMRTKCSLMAGVEAYPSFLEVKNEIGEGDSDPIAQAECDYVAIVTSDEYTSIRQACCCPSLLIGMAGPNLTVSGAVFTDHLISQRLTDYIYLGPVPSYGSQSSPHIQRIYRVAQLIRALEGTLEELRSFYMQLKPLPQPSDGFCYPHFDRYSVGHENFQITYLERLCPELPTTAVFKAEARDIDSGATCEVVVKFTYSYGKEGHELLAKCGLAPALKYCEREDSVGGMLVVVMDWVTDQFFVSRMEDDEVIQSLRTAVKVLHDNGLVFGDLREPNVLVNRQEKTVKLIDFDWCGPDRSARYPITINLNTDPSFPYINWHSGTKRGGLIAKVHDAHMFYVLTGMLL